MIALVLLAMLSQAISDDEAQALVNQAVEHIVAADQALAFVQGQCATVYPAGSSDPYAVQAQASVIEIGSDALTMAVTRGRQVRWAEGAESERAPPPSIRECVTDMDEASADLRQGVDGLRGLLRTLDRQ